MSPAELGAIVWDAWRAERGGPAAIAHRQATRLAALVRFAREHSPLYRELYRGLPAGEVRLEQLPSVTKSRLMDDFDAWVTDPGVTRAGIREFLADPSLVGRRYLGHYLAITTSGITNVRAILLHDPAAVLRYRALTLLRGFLPRLAGPAVWPNVRQGNRVAALVIGGGHFGGATHLSPPAETMAGPSGTAHRQDSGGAADASVAPARHRVSMGDPSRPGSNRSRDHRPRPSRGSGTFADRGHPGRHGACSVGR